MVVGFVVMVGVGKFLPTPVLLSCHLLNANPAKLSDPQAMIKQVLGEAGVRLQDLAKVDEIAEFPTLVAFEGSFGQWGT